MRTKQKQPAKPAAAREDVSPPEPLRSDFRRNSAVETLDVKENPLKHFKLVFDNLYFSVKSGCAAVTATGGCLSPRQVEKLSDVH